MCPSTTTAGELSGRHVPSPMSRPDGGLSPRPGALASVVRLTDDRPLALLLREGLAVDVLAGVQDERLNGVDLDAAHRGGDASRDPTQEHDLVVLDDDV